MDLIFAGCATFIWGLICGVLWSRKLSKVLHEELAAEQEEWTNYLIDQHSNLTGQHLNWFKANILKEFAVAQQEHQDSQASGYYHGSEDEEETDDDDDDDDDDGGGLLN